MLVLYCVISLVWIKTVQAQFMVANNTNKIELKNKILLANHTADKNQEKQAIDDDLNLDEEWNYNSDLLETRDEIPHRIFTVYSAINNSISKSKYMNEACSVRIIFSEKSLDQSHVIKFDLSSLKEDERILDADLMYFFAPHQLNGAFTRQMVLRVYQLTSQEDIKNITYLRKTIDSHKLMNVVYVSYARSAWQTFNVKKVLEEWMSQRNNHGIVMTVSTANGHGYLHNYIINDTNVQQMRTYLLITTAKRQLDINIRAIPKQPLNETNCKRIERYVNFKKMAHLQKIIIAPDGYMAYDCDGSCSAESLTNHMRLLRKSQNITNIVRDSYCVPTKYSSLPIMFYDKFKNIVIKVYKEMSVAYCGCR